MFNIFYKDLLGREFTLEVNFKNEDDCRVEVENIFPVPARPVLQQI
jgi:hypothetical protein